MEEQREILCPLCEDAGTRLFYARGAREFRRCRRCLLTFVPRAQHLDADSRLARYRSHQNSPRDPGYRAFLDKMARNIVAKLPPGSVGLDYGSGPGPTLSVMLEEKGFKMRIYDPFFAPDRSALIGAYDFITCTETVEHFARPAVEFRSLDRLLRPGGRLGIMTQILEDDASFPGWWYHRDPTHIAFYRHETMRWIADRHGWLMESPEPNVILFRKRAKRQRRAD